MTSFAPNRHSYQAKSRFRSSSSPFRASKTAAPINGASSLLYKKLAKYKAGFCYFKNCSRFSNSVSKFSSSENASSPVVTKLQVSKRGNRNVVTKGHHKACPFQRPSVLPQNVLVAKIRWRSMPCFGSKSSQQVYPNGTFEDGESHDNKVPHKQGGLHDKYRSYGRLSHRANTPKLSQQFLHFLWQGQSYQFITMPFGLNVAPRVFTKLMKPIIAWLRDQGVRMIIFLYDVLVLAPTIDTLNQHARMTINLLESSGFLINYKKSTLVSTQIILFLGMLIDLSTMEFVLPTEKSENIQKKCWNLLKTQLPSIRQISRVLDLMWWIRNLPPLRGSPILPPPPPLLI